MIFEGQEVVPLQGTCKFCKRTINLLIDKEYHLIGDCYGLIPMGTCNSCADYRSKASLLLERIRRRCIWLDHELVPTKEMMEKVEKRLRFLLGAYVNLLAGHWQLPVPEWDEGILENLMQHPKEMRATLRRIPMMFGQKKLL